MSLCEEYTRYQRGPLARQAADDAGRAAQMVLVREWLARSLSQRAERKAWLRAGQSMMREGVSVNAPIGSVSGSRLPTGRR